MWLSLLIILGTCLGGIAFGFFVYWVITQIQKTLRAKRPNTIGKARPASSTNSGDKGHLSTELPLKKVDVVSDVRNETENEIEDDDWQNSGISGISEKDLKKEDDDWLFNKTSDADGKALKKEDEARLFNGISDISEEGIKKEDAAWLNAGIEDISTNISELGDWSETGKQESEESPDAAWLSHDIANPPEIKIQKDGSVINITITTSSKQGIEPEHTLVDLSMQIFPQNPYKQEMDPFKVEVITPELMSAADLQETDKSQSSDSPDSLSTLMDEITVRPVDSPITDKTNWGLSDVA
jgi:hypothetical protein